MRKDMLSSLASGDEEDIRFGIPAAKDDKPKEDTAGDKARQEDPKQEEGKEVDWPSMVSGTKRVLSMTVSLRGKSDRGQQHVRTDF